jgi:hypothetical protein
MIEICYRKNDKFTFLTKIVAVDTIERVGLPTLYNEMIDEEVIRLKKQNSEMEYDYFDIIETNLLPLGNKIMLILGGAFISLIK